MNEIYFQIAKGILTLIGIFLIITFLLNLDRIYNFFLKKLERGKENE